MLNISQPGQAGGYAVADILFGKAVPSGKLTATWARHYGDYPSADTYGYRNGDLEKEEYREEIFVGYRHFDRENLPVLFPFGYGLSYTSFLIRQRSVREETNSLELAVSVQNTGGTYAGKETVQVYATFPQTGMEKEKSGWWDSPKQNVCCLGKYSSWRLKYQKHACKFFGRTECLVSGSRNVWHMDRCRFTKVRTGMGI